MKKEIRELMMQLEQAKAEVRQLLVEDKVEEAEKRMEEVRALQKRLDLLRQLEDMDANADDVPGRPVNAGPAQRDMQELEAEYKRVFLRAIRRQRLSADERSIIAEYEQRVMHSGGVAGDTDGDVGLLVPQDIQTRINEIMRDLPDLSQYIRVEQVATAIGSRVLEKDEDMTALPVLDEYQPAQELDNPKFVPIQFSLVKRGGFLPLTKELLQDTDQNIIAYVTDWIARKVVVTRNSLISQLLNGLTAKALADLDAIKRVLNVDLDPAISVTATIITNQDGFNYLDTLKDAQGRYLLMDDITRPGQKMLFGRPVVVVSNRYLPSREDAGQGKTFAPIYIGNGKQFAVWFTRGTYELASTDVGGEAWRRASTELRVITRDDLKQWDAAAMVKGELDVTPAA